MADQRRSDLSVLLLHNLDPGWEACDLKNALEEVKTLEKAIRAEGHIVKNVPIFDSDLAASLKDFHPGNHIVFNWCEGFPGIPFSEALVAESLESLGFVYTGSTPEVLALSWDKGRVKHLLRDSGVPTPAWRMYNNLEVDGWGTFPAIVKPAREHSSSGVTSEAVALSPEKLRARIAYVLENFRQPALVEDFIDGREFHVSLWGNNSVEMLPPAEMDFSAFKDVRDRLCTFDSKFNPGSRHYDQIRLSLPAMLDEKESEDLEQVAQAAYRVMGCRDYARLDIRLRDGIFYVLDVNPNPDISSDTSMACAAEVAGYSYGAMLSKMVRLASHRHPLLHPQEL
ncbi:MAG: ATP-grasp domain-containing protein [Deltaproteobacteria bacterium]|nr:ATP-grasp domain-containing protein [Deltaproteobacteria bacterium]